MLQNYTRKMLYQFQGRLIVKEGDFAEQATIVRSEQEQAMTKISYLERMFNLLKDYVNDKNQDKKKLQDQIYALERHTEMKLKLSQDKMQS